MTTTELPPGIYRIALSGRGDVEPALLTRIGNDRVTISPPGARPNPSQEWGIIRGQGPGNIIIKLPFPFRPTSYLTYEGAPENPKQDERVECRPEHPPTEWHPTMAPGFRYHLRVDGSDLGIRFSPATISPPILELGFGNQLEWVFERVHVLNE